MSEWPEAVRQKSDVANADRHKTSERGKVGTVSVPTMVIHVSAVYQMRDIYTDSEDHRLFTILYCTAGEEMDKQLDGAMM